MRCSCWAAGLVNSQVFYFSEVLKLNVLGVSLSINLYFPYSSPLYWVRPKICVLLQKAVIHVSKQYYRRHLCFRDQWTLTFHLIWVGVNGLRMHIGSEMEMFYVCQITPAFKPSFFVFRDQACSVAAITPCTDRRLCMVTAAVRQAFPITNPVPDDLPGKLTSFRCKGKSHEIIFWRTIM